MSDQTSAETPPTPEERALQRKAYLVVLAQQTEVAEAEERLGRAKRNTTVYQKEELEARFAIYHNTSRIRELALDLKLVTQDELNQADQNKSTT